ncbi:hypothetical protein [Prevotella melaninogenica]|nr:hypothetical protein [Prevotella melaninogenica]
MGRSSRWVRLEERRRKRRDGYEAVPRRSGPWDRWLKDGGI